MRGRGVPAALLSGVLAAQAFPPLDFAPLAWVALAPLFVALDGVGARRGFRLGLLQGLTFFALLLPWVPLVARRHGHLPWILAVGCGALLVGVLALYHGALGALLGWLTGVLGRRALVVAPCAWVAVAEAARLGPFGGFSWGWLGYSQWHSGALGLAPGLGVFGLSLLLATSGALAAAAALAAGGRRIVAAALCLLLPVGAGLTGRLFRDRMTDAGPEIAVAAVQGNVAQDEKWDATQRAAILERHLELTRQAAAGGARLIAWPESSTLEQVESSPRLQQALQAIAVTSGASLVLGSVHSVPGGGYTNAAFLLEPGRGLTERYDKIRLVPFGETVPLAEWLFFVRPMVQEIGDFRPGTARAPLGTRLTLAGTSAAPTPFGVAICYEITFPEPAAAEVRAGAGFLVTLTNDAWFGRSAAPRQHFAMAVFRAAETRRWLLRAANTGISGLIAPDGRIVAATDLFVPGLVTGTLRPRRDLTPAARHPHAVAWGCVIVTALAAVVAVRRTAFPTRRVPA